MTLYGFLSTYPPTQCGLATFTAALRTALVADGDAATVVRVLDGPAPAADDPPEVAADLLPGSPAALDAAADALNACDVAIIQHEYGIYGGRDGREVLALLPELRIPVIVVLHTVLAGPTPDQRAILERIADLADAVVVMSRMAAERLLGSYAVDASRIAVIPHGAWVRPAELPARTIPRRRAPGAAVPTILTWGLIGPGKGIEWGVEALALLRAAGVEARYLVAGQTHPKVLEREGERYRDSLRERAERLRVADALEFDAAYRDTESLRARMARADVILLPYDSAEQVTSGVLIESVAAGRPVVATAFPHARELLADGTGLVVPRKDPVAMAAALRRVLTEPDVAASMAAAAGRTAPSLDWGTIAESYRRLTALVAADRAALVA